MSASNDKADSPLPQIKTQELQELIHQFSTIQDRVSNVFAGYRFICEAVLAMTDPESIEVYEDWQYGFFLHQQWAGQQAKQIKAEMRKVKEALKQFDA